MNIKKLFKYHIFSILLISILGTLLHFTFHWSNYNLIIGVFSAVNESAWEHLKLLFFPTLISLIFGYLYIGKNIPNFLCAKTFGLILSMCFIIVFFYTYTGVIGTNIAFFNIISFFISIFLGEFISYRIIISNSYCNNKIAFFTLITLFICFIIFTYFPPNLGLFQDPITNTFGVFI